MYTPDQLVKVVSDVSLTKVNRKFLKVLVSSMMAGIFISLGYFTYIIMMANTSPLDNLVLNRFLGALIFCVGIVMVLVAGADLFTGNCLVMFGVINKRLRFVDVLVHLLIVLLGNFLGSLFIVILIYFSNAQTSSIINYTNEVAAAKISLNFVEAIFRGILCNIVVAIGVYMAYAAKDIAGKILAAGIAVTAFVILGFEHSVANMFLLPFSSLNSNISFLDIMVKNIVPVVIGNFIGGGIIIPFAYSYLFAKE